MATSVSDSLGPVSQKAALKGSLLQAVAQLDMLVTMFGDMAPEKVKTAALALKVALKDWADNG